MTIVYEEGRSDKREHGRIVLVVADTFPIPKIWIMYFAKMMVSYIPNV